MAARPAARGADRGRGRSSSLLLVNNGDDDPAADSTDVPSEIGVQRADRSRRPRVSRPRATPDTFDIDARDYVGRNVDDVADDLRASASRSTPRRWRTRVTRRPDTVESVSPTDDLQEGDTVTVTYWDEPPPPEPRPSPSPPEPTEPTERHGRPPSSPILDPTDVRRPTRGRKADERHDSTAEPSGLRPTHRPPAAGLGRRPLRSSASCSAAAAWPRSARAPTPASAGSSRSSGCAPTSPATRRSRPGSAARPSPRPR